MKKVLKFEGGSRSDLIRFPIGAKRDAGFQLELVQRGEEPDDWKPMPSVGVGVKEIRISDNNNIFRIIYVAKFHDAIYVLHVFQKKSMRTKQQDIKIAKKRYKELKKRQR